MNPRVRVFVVDDHALVLEGLCRVLSGHPDVEVVGRASTAPEALRLLRSVATDVVLVDLALGRGSGLDLIQTICAELPQRRCIVLTMHDPLLYAERALRAGARGFIGKDAPPSTMFEAIFQVSRGQVALPEGIQTPVLLRLAGIESSPAATELSALTDREIEVLRLIGEGLSTRDIAQRLGISTKTVEAHRINVKAKLRIEGLGELIRFAVTTFGRSAPP